MSFGVAGINGKIVIIGFACISGMTYVSGRIGTTLIPDNSKPTATWGRKAVGLVAVPRVSAMTVARLPKESTDEKVHCLR